jgi:hypothetical protein
LFLGFKNLKLRRKFPKNKYKQNIKMKTTFIKNDLIDFSKSVNTSNDNANYFGLLFKKELEKSKNGFDIGRINYSNGNEFRILLHGVPQVTNFKGDVVGTPEEYLKYITEDKMQELNSEVITYIEIKGRMEEKDFFGIFYCLGEIISYMEQFDVKNPELKEYETASPFIPMK